MVRFASLPEPHQPSSASWTIKLRNRLKSWLAEFRKGVAYHRAEGASEERIRQILSAGIRLAVQGVQDAELCAWLCDEFSKAADLAPIVNTHPLTQTLH
jgi:hypothetical protein